MLRTILGFLMLLVICCPVWALQEARLVAQSYTGQTVQFNLGSLDGVKEGEFAVIVKQIRDLDQRDLRLVPAAKAKNIKTNSDSSIWVLYYIYDHELFVKGDPYLILSESTMLKGKRDLKLGRLNVVADKKQVKALTKSALADDQNRLPKLKNKYQEVEKLHENKEQTDLDAELIDVDTWEKSGQDRHRSALYRSVHTEEFRRNVRLATFEKMVTAYLKKVNDPNFNYDAFYDEQMRSEFANEFRRKTVFTTEYEQFLKDQSLKASSDAKLYRSLLEKGDSWSEDFSDEELRRTLNQVSILREKDRREFVAARPNRYSAALDYGYFLNDNQTEKDPSYRRDNRYSVEADFEAVPMLKHPTMERFTVNTSFRSNKTAFDAKSFNANVDEYSVTLGANWYPIHPSYAVETPIFLLGTYIRSGFATVNAPTVGEKAKYTTLSVPGFRAGMKYLLRNNFGLRIIASMETLKLEQYEANKLNPTLPNRANLVEMKVGVGMAYGF